MGRIRFNPLTLVVTAERFRLPATPRRSPAWRAEDAGMALEEDEEPAAADSAASAPPPPRDERMVRVRLSLTGG